MVIEDQSMPLSKKKSSRKTAEEWPLASPVDRLAATVVDIVILLPLFSLALALVKKEITLAQLFGTNPEFHFLFVVYYVIAPVVIGIIYQTLFISILGATPGKYFFGLKVQDVWTHSNPHWQRSFLRGLLWWVDVLLFFPLVALFSDSKRRPIHDRLSDTIVLSKPTRAVQAPGKFETYLSRVFFTSLITFSGLYLLGQSPLFYELAAQRGIEFKDWVGGKGTCPAIDHAHSSWPEGVGKDSRVKMALALFAAQEIDKNCLNAEADHYLWLKNKQESDRGVGYLAKAFAFIDDAEVSEEYLKKVCVDDQTSEACEMSRIFSLSSEENGGEINKKLAKVYQKQASIYAKIWSIRYYSRFGNIDKALELIDKVSPNPALSNFLSEYRVKSLWQNDQKDEAENSFKLYWENNGNNDGLHLANWLCYEEVVNSCSGAQSASCQVFGELIKSYPSLLEEATVSLMELRLAECRGSQISSQEKGFSQDIQVFVKAFDSEVWDKSEVFENLKSFAEDESQNLVLRIDAFLRVIDVSQSIKEIEQLLQTWSSLKKEDSWYWSKVGYRLVRKLHSLKSKESKSQALKVAHEIYKFRQKSKSALQQLVLLNFEQGDQKRAWHWLKKHQSLEEQRRPASVDEWESVKSQLEKRFGGQ